MHELDLDTWIHIKESVVLIVGLVVAVSIVAAVVLGLEDDGGERLD